MRSALLLAFVMLLLEAKILLAADKWRPLRIGIAHYGNEDPLPPLLRKGLYQAIDNIQNIVSVNEGIDEKVIRKRYLTACSNRSEVIESLDYVMGNETVLVRANSEDSLVLEEDEMNFVLLLQTNDDSCLRSNLQLATASICFYADQQKPILGKLTVCTRNSAWKSFESPFDLFRHEVLHALGFGLILPDTSERLQSTKRWKDGRGRQQTITTHGMHFSDRALAYVRKHFSCANLNLVEAENEHRKHLNEYVFGNELMTPLLNNGKSYFTMISALILEDTFTGGRQWYQTNFSMIQEETKEYWYGWQWGCTFTSRSCTEYIAEQLKSQRSSFPFCTYQDYGRKHRTICAKHSSNTTKFTMQCHGSPGPDAHAHGLLPISLRDYFPQLRWEYANQYGSSHHHRFCPFSENVLNGNIKIDKRDSIFVDC